MSAVVPTYPLDQRNWQTVAPEMKRPEFTEVLERELQELRAIRDAVRAWQKTRTIRVGDYGYVTGRAIDAIDAAMANLDKVTR